MQGVSETQSDTMHPSAPQAPVRSPDLKPPVHWRKVVAEGVTIVVSILLAFALNAWWEGVKAARDERVVLEGLRSDFEASLAEAKGVRLRLDSVEAAAIALLKLTGPAPRAASADEATQLLPRLLEEGAYYRPVQGS